MGAAQEEHGGRIVVGVDGSASSKSALAWAVRQAKLTDASVEAVTTWQPPNDYGYGGLVAGLDDYARTFRQVLDEAIAEVAGDKPAVPIERVVVEDNAAHALILASKGADLLVVGSRGHGGFTGALLGSVGQHVVQQADCPVVIIRDGHKS